jgi:hypothetical protein
VRGHPHVSGTTAVPFATDEVTTLRKARTALALKSEKPTAYVLNPTDLETLDLTRVDGATGEFLALEDRIYGRLPVVPSLGVPAGVGLLADWKQTRLYVRENLRLTPTRRGNYSTRTRSSSALRVAATSTPSGLRLSLSSTSTRAAPDHEP